MDALNFCAKAIAALHACDERLSTFLSPIVEGMISYLHEAQKFILPDGGKLFEEGQFLNWEGFDIILPYPVTAIEYRSNNSSEKNQFMDGCIVLTVSRAALSINKRFEAFILESVAEMIEERPWDCPIKDEFIVIWALRQVRSNLGWVPNLCGVVCPSGDEGLTNAVDSEFSMTVGKRPPNDMKAREMAMVLHPKYLDYAAKGGESKQDMYNGALYSMFDEIIATKQLCQVLDCENIKTMMLRPSEKLNKKRLSAGKLPLYSYHLLRVEQGKKENSSGRGPTHQSPRFHWRRGHIRRLSGGAKTWVRPCTVGDSRLGLVDKDYIVGEAST